MADRWKGFRSAAESEIRCAHIIPVWPAEKTSAKQSMIRSIPIPNRPAFFAACLSITLILNSGLATDGTAAKSKDGPATSTKTVRLLTIGNSFSANATKYLGDLARAAGHILIHRPIVVGGASLELHAGKIQANEGDPLDKAGLYTNGRGLKEQLLSDKWDFVTIQQASIKSHDLATYQPFANQLRDFIRQHAGPAELLVHQTWAYRVDDPRFTKSSGKVGEPKTQQEMYVGLSAAYTAIAAELGVRRIPVGDAFYLADTDQQWRFRPDTKFDPKTALPPALPDQKHSLHKGWTWKTTKDRKQTLTMDGHHANTAGEYLGASVWYEVLFGESPVGNIFVPSGIDPAYARFLQETAHRAVFATGPPSK
jgi:hypothetical protein